MKGFLKKVFDDMKKSAAEQHSVDKANFEAAKAEARANFEEAKAKGRARCANEKLSEERIQAISVAEKRKAAANERIEKAKAD